MDLHRIENNQPDWENGDKNLNVFQKIASKTHSVVTPGNLTTSVGLGLVIYGSTKIGSNLPESVGLVTVGRLADIADGMVANVSGTKSPLGEKLDAVADKIGILAAASGIIYYNTVPLPVTLGIVAQNAFNSVVSVKAKTDDNIELHSSRSGKLSAVSQWLTLGFFALSTYGEQKSIPKLSEVFKYVGYFSLAPTTVLSVTASRGYYKALKENKNEKKKSN